MSRHISSSNQAASSKPARSPESYASLHRREAAAEILGSYEKLSWYSFQRCEVRRICSQCFLRVAV